MAQPVYPITLPNPDVETFTREPAIDPVHRTDLEDGNELVMRTRTAIPLAWSFQYRHLSVAHRDALMTFWSGAANCGAIVVRFTDPTNAMDYFVRFAAKPQCSLEDTQQQLWRVQILLRQAIGSYT